MTLRIREADNVMKMAEMEQDIAKLRMQVLPLVW